MTEGALLRNYLRANRIGVTEFAKKIGVSRQTAYQYFKTERFDKKTIDSIQAALGIDFNRLVSNNQGKPLESNEANLPTYNTLKEIPVIEHIPQSEGGKSIPMIKGEFFATISEAMSDVIAMKQDAFINIPMFSRGEYAIPVTGNSMKGVINHGDWIVIRRIYNPEKIFMGEIYVVVSRGDNLRTIKYLQKHEDESKLWMVPYNIEQFSEQEIDKEDILEIYLVIGLFRKVGS